MDKNKHPFLIHIRQRIVTGFLLIAPLGVTLLVLKFLFSGLANILTPMVKGFLGEQSPFLQAVVSFLLLLALLYLLGLIGSNLAGRGIIVMTEKLVARIPFVRAVYAGARQIIHTFGSQKNSSFERVVWTRFPTDNAYAIGFVTGTVIGDNDSPFLKVFVPTAPNPTSGFLVLVRPEDALDSTMSVETAIQMILSGGIVSPDTVTLPGAAE